MNIRIEERSGFALPAALLAIVVVGALVTGGVYAAMEEDRSSANVQHGNHAFLAAEQGLEDLLGTKNRVYFQDSVGTTGTADTIGPIAVTVDGIPAQYTLFVQRLSTRLFKVDSEGEVTGAGRYSGSKRRIAEMMRITYTLVPKDRAMTAYGPMRLRGQSGVIGNDSIPTGWDECEDLGLKSAVQAHTDDPKYMDIKGNPGLVGNPAVKVDATMDSSDFIEYGDMHIEELKTWANHTLPPATYTGMAPSLNADGTCNTSDPNNWGDPQNPLGACHYYWPIIYVTGNLSLSTGVGQGILIVDGDLSLSGNVSFYGIVFVYGGLKFTGSNVSPKLVGSVNVFANGDTTEMDIKGAGSAQTILSSCAIERAHLYNSRFSRPIPLGVRRFIDISGLGVT